MNLGLVGRRRGRGSGGTPYRAARTHLVIHPDASGARAEFLQWDSAAGPRSFEKS